ncbi:hypothetical protein SARC_10330 [Sphaeroforma arctica JP610]|uniref:Uncharacterized protein n=1 Tax=Sphaeroforma arctica JP610 TaxID=667725 RepID=A0A0L0FL57_9EUKA|nr:hypothetical protein SARC_10330 [Sphaeroforma arctica JP610]KNC77201.1 hypothetical protein SARC_10330 [Sphaeroforma arctica JP610]|eukprot:XP_014151103.1 hypothetical protein SARC_10330 [Sphaeroforma arctica JP610]
MAEFEIIGEGMGDGAEEGEEIDEATRAFLDEEQAQIAQLGGGEDEFNSAIMAVTTHNSPFDSDERVNLSS